MTPPSSAPLTPEEFSSLLAALDAPSRLVVAVSGGPDSITLARLAAEYARSAGAEILAASVDHGLREGSRAEAEMAGRWCREAGLSHAILAWDGEKPVTGIQESARIARYRLLAGFAERNGAGAILTGHSADDQAETVFMRLGRGAGPEGLGAMESSVLIADGAGAPVRLLRPLLNVARVRIAATARAYALDFVNDPSNSDMRFERVRVRGLLAALEEQGMLARDALLLAANRARIAAAIVKQAGDQAFRDAGGCFYHLGWARFDSEKAAYGGPAFLGALARVIRAVSGEDHRPDDAAVKGALDQALGKGAATLGGALLKRQGERLFAMREPAAVLGRAGVAPLAPVTLGAGARLLWDRRFILENHGDAPLKIAPLGPSAPGLGRALHDCPDEALASLPDALMAPPYNLVCESLAEERYQGGIIRYA